MDKYQKFMLKNVELILEQTQKKPERAQILSNDVLDIKQDDDITITKSTLSVRGLFISNIFAVKGEQQAAQSFEVEEDNRRNISFKKYNISLDFDDKLDHVLIEFEKNYADPYKLTINFIDSDKEAYYSKIEYEKKKKLMEKMAVEFRTGDSIVNIYFQPCCENYKSSVIELYTANGKWSEHPSVMGRNEVFRPRLLSGTPNTFMGKFKVEEGMFFKSITGLAKGAYCFILSQLSDGGEILLKTDYIYFAIQ